MSDDRAYEKIEALEREIHQLRQQIDTLHSQLDHTTGTAVQFGRDLTRLRSELGRAQYAVDCAIVMIEALVIFIPEGMPLHPGVGVAQGRLDRALHALHHPDQPR